MAYYNLGLISSDEVKRQTAVNTDPIIPDEPCQERMAKDMVRMASAYNKACCNCGIGAGNPANSNKRGMCSRKSSN